MARYFRTVGPDDHTLNRNAVTPNKIAQYGCDNLTQFAEYLGIHRTTLARAYTGSINVGAKLLTAIATKTNMPIGDIIETHPEGTRLYLPGDKGYDPGDWPEISVRGRT